MKISKYVSYKEVIYSRTAISRGLDNEPSADQITNIRAGARKLFDPLRMWVGGALKITSCFRSPELNKAIGGASKSQHMANDGCAFDIDDTFGHKTNLEVFNHIKDNMEFDQLINEFPNEEGNPSWVHVSYRKNGLNRKQVLKAVKEKGRTKYYPWF